VEGQKPMKPLAVAIGARLRPGDRIIGYRVGMAASLIFYTNHPVEAVGDPTALRRRLCAPGRVFLVAPQDDLAVVEPTLRGLERVDVYGRLAVAVKPVAVTCGDAT